MSTEHKLSEIRQIAITVSDVGTALPFYRDVLGLTFLFSPASNLAFLAAGGVRIMLSTPQGAGTVGQNSIIYFTTTDIAAAHGAIVARGAKNERTPALIQA
ncbi:MAG: VOC family protein [Verrucomicrobia bacterium]|nr:VOC family protein [Verrucomicrobiota bacterium]